MTVAPEPAVTGIAICDARAHLCRCHKPAGHVEAGDPVHSCPPDRCTGQWKGNYMGRGFEIVRLPMAVGIPRPWDFE